MIADKELRELFKTESGERLQHLDDGLLRLEKTPADQSLLEDLFREAHSLKGAARMLGLTGIQTLAHQLEDTLGAANKDGTAPQPEAMASMNQTLDAIRRLVQMEIGETAGAEQVNAEFGTRNSELKHEAAASEPTIPHSEIRTPNSTAFRIETIRVDPKKLDALLTQAGELTVTKIRIARRLAGIDALLDYCDEWARVVHTGAAHSGQFPAQAGEPIVQRRGPPPGML